MQIMIRIKPEWIVTSSLFVHCKKNSRWLLKYLAYKKSSLLTHKVLWDRIGANSLKRFMVVIYELSS